MTVNPVSSSEKAPAADKKDAPRTREAQLPAEIGAIGASDEFLTPDELIRLSLFDSQHFEKEKHRPDFAKSLGTTVLRKCSRGRVICRQGDAAAVTAFYILSTEDVIALRTGQLQTIGEILAARGRGETGSHQYFSKLSQAELEQKQRDLAGELEFLQKQKAQFDAAGQSSAPQRPAATVLLAGDFQPQLARRSLFGRILARLRGGAAPADQDLPESIPIDAPVDLKSRDGFRADLHEGTLFGEMSCLNRSPRSATVVASRDCYMLEMLRSVLDALHKDPTFKKKIDDYYRDHVMEGHVRRLSIFADLTDDEFAELKESVTLEDFPAGSVIIEEHAPSDAVFVVRSGLVKVLNQAAYSLLDADFTEAQWSRLPGELAAAEHDQSPLAIAIWKSLATDARAIVTAHSTTALPNASRAASRQALNAVIAQGAAAVKEIKIDGRAVKVRAELGELLGDGQVAEAISAFPDEVENWSEYECRVFCRYMLERVCRRGIPRRLAICGPATICSYVGRGEVLGEIGVLLDRPRSATCIAYDHPDGYDQRLPDSRTGAVPSRVEVLKIGREAFERVLRQSPRIRERVSEMAAQRQEKSRVATAPDSGGRAAYAAPGSDFERLGLVQGQQLMLIDLDRCTRCGACVDACISAHDDGNSRLYLDGMRIDKYLVPLTCRKCLDPVCMIGCPVGSIQRGETGEIQIRNWCIGCSMCADQCPYGSIHMNDVAAVELSPLQRLSVPEGVELKQVSERAVVCDMCSSLPSRSPSCVYACPHDAAMRIDGREFFLSGALIGPASMVRN